MRIIAGEFRGRKLLEPASVVTRPITDRAKQSLFDMLHPLPNAAVIYDCFSGTGSMGLEALSRGAKFCRFFEQDRAAVQRLRQNIDALDIKDRCEVIAGDLFRWFEKSRPADVGQVEILFLDPPYRFVWEKVEAIQSLAQAARNHLRGDGVVVFRHDAADSLVLPGFERYDQRSYGQMAIELLRPSI